VEGVDLAHYYRIHGWLCQRPSVRRPPGATAQPEYLGPFASAAYRHLCSLRTPPGFTAEEVKEGDLLLELSLS
jgi:hypothetical protein